MLSAIYLANLSQQRSVISGGFNLHAADWCKDRYCHITNAKLVLVIPLLQAQFALKISIV